MSRSFDGKSLLCDASGCVARVDVPVALGNISVGDRSHLSPPPVRWLSVQRNGLSRHFCQDHAGTVLPYSDASVLGRPASIFARDIVLVMDSSPEASAALEQAAELIAGQTGGNVTVLFVACGRCAPKRESPPTGRTLDQLSTENYCPGTQKSLNNLSAVLASRSITYRLEVQTGGSVAATIAQRAERKSPEIILVAASLAEGALPGLPVPVLVIPGMQG